jgi:hypothetical protein
MANQTNSVNSVDLLKSQYAAALLKQQAQPVAPLGAQFVTPSEADIKRGDAERKENNFYLERLRFRMKDSGVASGDIKQIEADPKAALSQTPVPLSHRILQHARTAILVIHGIGEQNPYETLDQFARNLTRYLKHEGGIDDLTLSAQKIDHNDWVEAMVRLETNDHGPRTEEGHASALIDLYEYYWTPMTEDKISYKETISWLIKTSLTPIRMLDQNVIAIKDEPDPENLARRAIFYRELWRIGMLYIPLAALLAVLGAWMPSAFTYAASLSKNLVPWVGHLKVSTVLVGGLIVVLFAISLVMYWILLKQLVAKWLRRVRQQEAMLQSSITRNTFIAATAIALVGVATGYLFKVNLAQYARLLLHWKILVAIAAFGIARVLQYFLSAFVGDVAVYVNADAKAKNYAVRRAILNQAATAITRILKDQERSYDQVIIAGHSLGSVIAYDALNELMNRCQQGAMRDVAIYATSDQLVGTQPPEAAIHRGDLDKIKGLVTFGSPLDKVYYFFREYVPDEQSIRSQILALLRSFRTRHSGRDYGIYRLQPYIANQLSNIRWLNAWSPEDPVSGMLHFYAPVERREFHYLIPIYAHLSYWEDLSFYEFFSEPLLLGSAVPEPHKFKLAVA